MANLPSESDNVSSLAEKFDKDLLFFREYISKNVLYLGLSEEEAKELDDCAVRVGESLEQAEDVRNDADKVVDAILSKYNASFNSQSDRTDFTKRILEINGIEYFDADGTPSFKYEEVPLMVASLIKKYEEYSKMVSVVKYEELQAKIKKGNGFIANLLNARIHKKLEDLLQDPYVVAYIDIKKNISVLREIKKTFDSSSYMRLVEHARLAQININASMAYRTSVMEKYKERVYNIIALAYIRLYRDNSEYLTNYPEEAKAKWIETISKEVSGLLSIPTAIEISDNIIELLQVYERAKFNNEKIRENIKKTGKISPCWTRIKDNALIGKLKEMDKLPDTIRVVDGVYEQDIANTKFDELSIEFKLKDFIDAKCEVETSKEEDIKEC